MSWSTSDLGDTYRERVRVAEPVRAWEDNSLVRQALEDEAAGCVLVVDNVRHLDSHLLPRVRTARKTPMLNVIIVKGTTKTIMIVPKLRVQRGLTGGQNQIRRVGHVVDKKQAAFPASDHVAGEENRQARHGHSNHYRDVESQSRRGYGDTAGRQSTSQAEHAENIE